MTRHTIRPAGFRLVVALLFTAGLASLSGCSGCLQDPITAQQEAARKKLEEDAKRLEEERRKREAEKPDYEIGRFSTQPNNLEVVESRFKPGHWTSATLDVTANREDFHGTLVTEPLALENMPYALGTSRPVTLAKKQKKAVEFTFYVPPFQRSPRDGLKMMLYARGERLVGNNSQPIGNANKLPAHQFYFVVLSRDPDRYNYYSDLDSVRPPSGNLTTGEGESYYRLLLPRIEQRSPLPTNPLCWTSIAYVLWDDLLPDKLAPEQQQAMLDWIHWGGQLIISGPGTLNGLKETVFEPYLPADGGEAWDIKYPALVDLNKNWTIKGPLLRPAGAWSGQSLKLRPEGRVLVDSPAGPLLVERRLGQGRIVLSAFRLGQRELQDWKCFDGFFNACLLRRPPRQFVLSEMAEVRVKWVEDENLPLPPAPKLNRFDRAGRMVGNFDDDTAPRRLNPNLVSSVRIYSRDMDLTRNELDDLYRLEHKAAEIGQAPAIDASEALRIARETLTNALAGEELEEDAVGAGVAGWHDTNAVAQLARDSLSGGIVIPDANFILWVLASYLLVLVPLNFLVFRLVGRVEWAWFAVPVITIGFAVAVVRLAQLDVGFVRTQSEVGVVEVQGNYPRAHATRYTALYSSLSTTYDLRFADASAVVQPLPTNRLLKNQSRTDVFFMRDLPALSGGEKWPIGLSGFAVASNSQAMLHSEHMLDLGGPIFMRKRAGIREVVNHTNLNLEDAAVISPEGVAWIGLLTPKATSRLEFHKPQPDSLAQEAAAALSATGIKPLQDIWIAEREKSPTTARRFPPDVLNIRQLVRLAQNSTPKGEMRLVAWTDSELPGMRIEPAASQSRHANVVIVRLQPAPELAPRRDVNTRGDIEKADVPPEGENTDPFKLNKSNPNS